MSSENPQQQEATALDVETGLITCGSKARRKLYELEGVGDALDAGRQAEENEYPREGPAAVETDDEPRDPYEEAYLDE